ncbi:hypothetical protein CON22_26020 [Bacillus cereus]|nr:hypothetical protein CON22_26020 [Bacillus cereus]
MIWSPYSIQKKAIDLYFKEGMRYTQIEKELGIDKKTYVRSVKRFKEKGIKYLKIENEMLKKLMECKKRNKSSTGI